MGVHLGMLAVAFLGQYKGDPVALKSLDHRAIEIESGPLRWSRPILLLKAGSTRKVAQDHASKDEDSIMFWVTGASVGQPSQRKSVLLHINGVFWVSVCIQCFLSSCWALLRRVWFCLLYYCSNTEVLVCIDKILLSFSSWRVLAFSIITPVYLVNPFSRRGLKLQTHTLSQLESSVGRITLQPSNLVPFGKIIVLL